MSPANPVADAVDLARMCGPWYVVESNLDAWKSRICPVVIYEPITPTEKAQAEATRKKKVLPTRVKDITEFRTGGSLEKQSEECSYYLGIDTQSSTNTSVFKWDGSGMLGMLSCDWQMQKHDADYTWAIVVFDSTAFTKAGFDIYYREPVIPEEKLIEIRQIIESDPYLKARYVNMFKTIQDPRGRNRPGSKHHIIATDNKQ